MSLTQEEIVNIMDVPVPEINIPILKPMQFTAKGNVKIIEEFWLTGLKKPIIKNINKFADWFVFVCSRTSEKYYKRKS